LRKRPLRKKSYRVYQELPVQLKTCSDDDMLKRARSRGLAY